MKNYEQMSDFEVNKAVAERLGIKRAHVEDSVFINRPGLLMPVEFNPCNSPSDAWPVIVENGIEIRRSVCPAGSGYAYYARHDDVCSDYMEPLRAAMIVFLMMGDG